MKTVQLRRYRLDDATFDAWIEWFREVMAPARLAFGFSIESAYAVRSSHEFVWAVSVPGDAAGFLQKDEDWKASSARAAAMAAIPHKVISAQIDLVAPVDGV